MGYIDLYGASPLNVLDGYVLDPVPKRWEIFGESENNYFVRRRVFGFLWWMHGEISKKSPAIEKIY